MLIGARLLAVRSFDSGPMPPPLRIIRNIPVTRPDGRQAVLGDGIRPGLPTVIALWASWCGPCRREAPHIVDLRRRFGPDRLNLVYLNVREDGAPATDLAQFVSEVGIPPDAYLVMDRQHLSRLTNDPENLIPRTYLFDPVGAPTAIIVAYRPLALTRIAGLVQQYSLPAQ